MLVSKKYSENDVVTFKLVNGDEIVAKVISDTDSSFTISKPCSVIPSERGIGLMQALFSANINTNITLNKNHVMMHAPVIADIETHYIRTTTGIQPVTNKGGIIT
jgi:hypothetical protein